MKAIMKKNIALIVAAVMVLGIFMPILPGLIKAGASVDDATKIQNIKEKWGNMYYTMDLFKNSYYTPDSDTNRQVGELQATTGADALAVGGDYTSYDMTDNPTDRTAPTAQGTENYTVTLHDNVLSGNSLFLDRENGFSITDVYVYYKVEEVTAPGSLAMRACVGSSSSNRKTIGFAWRDDISATDATNGTWQKLSLYSLNNDAGFTAAMSENGWDFTTVKAMLTRTAQQLRTVTFQLLGGAEATISFGSVKAAIKAQVPSDAATANWTLKDWVVAAETIDSYVYQNYDELKAYIDELKAADEDLAELSELVRAWHGMTEKETIFMPTAYQPGAAYTEAEQIQRIKTAWAKMYETVEVAAFSDSFYDPDSITNRSTGTTTQNAAADVPFAGTNSTAYDMTDNPTANRTAPQNVETYTAFIGSGTTLFKNKDLGYTANDLYIPYKVNSVTSDGNLAVRTRVCSGSFSRYRSVLYEWRDEISADDQTNGTWQKLSIFDLDTDAGFTAAATANSWSETTMEVLLSRSNTQLNQISFQLLNGAEANISFGPLMAAKAITVPTSVTGGDTLEAWLAAAKTAVTQYAGSEALSALIAEIEGSTGPQTFNTATESAGITDIDTGLLGSNIANVDVSGIAEASNTKITNALVLSGYNGTDEYTDTAIAEKKVNLDKYNDVYMYFKVNDLEAAGGLQPMFNMTFTVDSFRSNTENIIPITAATTDWQMLPLDAFVDDTRAEDWRAFFKNASLNNLVLAAVGGLKADITFGSLVGEKFVELPENTVGWSNVDWVNAANDLDISNYENTADFAEILSELNVKYASSFEISDIKTAWNALIYKNPSDTIGRATFYCGDSENFTSTTANTHNNKTTAAALAAYPDELVEEGFNTKLLGGYTGIFDVVAPTSNDSKEGAVYFSSGYSGRPAEGETFSRVCRGTVTLTPQMHNVYLYYKVLDVEEEGSLLPRYQYNKNYNTMYYNTDNAISVTAEDEGKGWQVIEASDFFNGTSAEDWRNYFNATLSGLNVLATDGLKAKIAFGSVVTVNKVYAPSGAEADNWNLFEWVSAAEDLDLSDKTNTAQFLNTIDEIKNAHKDYMAISELKSAWKEVAASTSTSYRPSLYTIDETIEEPNLVTDKMVENSVDTRYLGTATATYDVKDRNNRSDLTLDSMTKDTVYLSNANASGNWKVNTTPYYKVAHENDLYFYYKVNSKTKNGQIKILMGYGEGNRGSSPYPFNRLISNYTITIDDNSVDKGWQKVSIAEVLEGTLLEDWQTQLKNYPIRYIGLMASEGVEANITFGSLVSYTDGQLPENTGKWNIADWVSAALALDQTRFAEDEFLENFRSALGEAIKYRDEYGITRTIISESHADSSTLDLTNAGTNILAGLEPDIIYYNGVKSTELGDHKWENLENLSDGNFTSEAVIKNVPFENGVNVGSYVDLYYTLKGTGRINNLVIAHSHEADKRNQKYSVSIAAKREELFSTETLIADKYDNSVSNDQIQTYSSGTSPEFAGRYVGIRIYNPAADMLTYDGIVRMAEIAAYGEVETILSLSTGIYDDTAIKAVGDNLLANPGVKYIGKHTAESSKDSFSNTANTGGPEVLFDGTNTSAAFRIHTTVTEKDQELQFYLGFDLKAVYDITKVLVQNVSNAGLQTGIYEVYASTLQSQMFAPESLIFRYDNRVAADGGPNGSTVTQLFNLHEGAMIGQFVAFRIVRPVCDWERAGRYINHDSQMVFGRQGRLAELGFYGELYEAPERKMNIIGHTPVDLYRTATDGVQTPITDSEYTGAMHRLTYDELALAADGAKDATIKQNGQTIDMVFNLANNMRIRKFQIYTLTKSIKHAKFYTAMARDDIWVESNCIYEYNNGAATDTIFKEYPDSPHIARYFRISILDTVNGDFDLTEIEAIGYSSQAFTYLNLIENRPETLTMYTEEKETGFVELYQKNYGTQYMSYNYPVDSIFDNNDETIMDLYYGKNNEVSMNMVFNMGGLQSIDRIAFYAASTWDYWPTKLRFYFGDREEDVWGDEAIDKSWTLTKPPKDVMLEWQKRTGNTEGADTYLPTEEYLRENGYTITDIKNGLYEYDIVPKTAQFVRIEILEGDNHNYTSDKVLGVMRSIQINGFSLVGTVKDDGSVLSFTDKKTGLRLDIMALEENDVYDKVKGMEVTTIEPSQYFLDTIKQQGMKFVTDIYEPVFIDKDGLPVTDIGGRQVRVCFPKSMYKGSDQPYIISLTESGEIVILESNDSNDDYYFVTIEDMLVMQFAMAEFISIPDEETPEEQPEQEEEEEEEYEEEDEEESSTKRRKKIRVIRKLAGGTQWWIYVIIAAGAVLVIGGGLLWYFLYFKKKRKKDEEENNQPNESNE